MDLLVHSNEMALWYLLLQDAQKNASIYLTETTECYLANLLKKFNTQPEVAHSVLGLDFLCASQLSKVEEQSVALQALGDKCLLLSGLFPERAQKRRVTVDYFVELGQGAYQSLSYHSLQPALFETLCGEFKRLMGVLAATRPGSGPVKGHEFALQHKISYN